MDNKIIQDMVRLLKTNPAEFEKMFSNVSSQDLGKVMAALQSIVDNSRVATNPTALRHLPMGGRKSRKTRKSRKQVYSRRRR